jgi:regulatory protein
VPPWAREPIIYEDDAAAEAAARAIVLRQLTGAPKTRRQLEQKLAEKDIPAHVSATVLDRFTEVELIDDAAFAESWVRQRARSKGLARSALRRELGQKGVAEASIDTALEQVDSDQERETAREMVAKKLAGSTGKLDRDKAMRRLVGMLGRKGYSSSLALGVIREEWDKLHG